MGWIRLKGGFRIGLGLLEGWGFIQLNDLFNKDDILEIRWRKGFN